MADKVDARTSKRKERSYKTLSNTEKEKLLNGKDSENTKKATDSHIAHFMDYIKQKELPILRSWMPTSLVFCMIFIQKLSQSTGKDTHSRPSNVYVQG